MVHAARDGAQATRPDPRERHAGGRLDRAARAAGGSAEAQPARTRHVRAAMPRPGEQGLLPQHPRAPAARRVRGGAARAGGGRPLSADARARPGELPARGPSRAPQGRPHPRSGARALAPHRHVPRRGGELRPRHLDRDRRGRAGVGGLDAGAGGLRRDAGRGTRVDVQLLARDAPALRLRLHRRRDLDERRGPTHAAVDPGRGGDRARRPGVHGAAGLEDARHPGDASRSTSS